MTAVTETTAAFDLPAEVRKHIVAEVGVDPLRVSRSLATIGDLPGDLLDLEGLNYRFLRDPHFGFEIWTSRQFDAFERDPRLVDAITIQSIIEMVEAKRLLMT
jgi:hypothetical protein